jgi:hypothetical protein
MKTSEVELHIAELMGERTELKVQCSTLVVENSDLKRAVDELKDAKDNPPQPKGGGVLLRRRWAVLHRLLGLESEADTFATIDNRRAERHWVQIRLHGVPVPLHRLGRWVRRQLVKRVRPARGGASMRK